METSANRHYAYNKLYEDQLRTGFDGLRFNKYLEREFREVYTRDSLQKTRLVLGLCTISVVVVALASLFTGSADHDISTSDYMFDLFALMVMAPVLGATLVVSYLDRSVLYQILLAASALVVGVAGTAIDVQASLAGQGYYFAGQIGWILIMWSMLGLLFTPATILCSAVSVFYMGCAIYAGLPSEQLFFEGFMLLNVNLLGGYSSYKIEHVSRQNFLESRILSQLAERDGQTGLYNRRAFDEHMDRLWRLARRENKPVTLMLIDIDQFKAYNDMYGHQAGDDALKQVAHVIASAAQRPLDIAARYGGEEFMLVLYGPATEYVLNLPERLRDDVMGLAIAHEGATATKLMSVSIGVAVVSPDSGRSQAGAIQMADEALYQAKGEGRNRVVIKTSGTTSVETGRFRIRVG